MATPSTRGGGLTSFIPRTTARSWWWWSNQRGIGGFPQPKRESWKLLTPSASRASDGVPTAGLFASLGTNFILGGNLKEGGNVSEVHCRRFSASRDRHELYAFPRNGLEVVQCSSVLSKNRLRN